MHRLVLKKLEDLVVEVLYFVSKKDGETYLSLYQHFVPACYDLYRIGTAGKKLSGEKRASQFEFCRMHGMNRALFDELVEALIEAGVIESKVYHTLEGVEGRYRFYFLTTKGDDWLRNYRRKWWPFG